MYAHGDAGIESHVLTEVICGSSHYQGSTISLKNSLQAAAILALNLPVNLAGLVL